MNFLPTLHDSLLAYTAIFICIGFGLLFLRKASGREAGPGYWSVAFFLNGIGFFFWAEIGLVSERWILFLLGEVFHMAGFLTLVYGVYRFTGRSFQRWNVYAVAGVIVFWFVAIILLMRQQFGAFFLYSMIRAILFLSAGRMILNLNQANSMEGRKLAGWGLVAWGFYVLLSPVLFRISSLSALAFGFLVGFHILVALGMVILVVDRMRLRAEADEKHIKRLEGLLPICSHCKKIRDDHDQWQNIEMYIRDRSEAEFTHGICPECAKEFYPEFSLYAELDRE